MLITLYGRVPSKKNSKQIFMNKKTGARFIASSDDYKDWEDDALLQLSQYVHKWRMSKQYQLNCTFYAGDLHKFDLSNKFESVADVMVLKGLLSDDNYAVLPRITLLFGGLDRKNPRVEIEVINLISNEEK